MELTFNWYKYSFFLGVRKKGVSRNTTAEGYGGGKAGPGSSIAAGRATRVREDGVRKKDWVYQLASSVSVAVKQHLGRFSGNPVRKEELILSLRGLLGTFPELMDQRALPCRVAINHVIQKESEQNCSIQLKSEDLEMIWSKVGRMELLL